MLNTHLKNKVIYWLYKNKENLGFGLILAFSFFIRIYHLGIPNFWIDESISSIASLNILDKGIPVFDSGWYYGRALFFHYIQAFFFLFGKSDFLVRFPSVIFGLLTIFLGYFIGKEYSKSGGIIVALFMGVFCLEVFFSRQARFYQLFQLLFFASIYFLYKSKKNKNFIWLALITFFLLIDTQIAGIVLAPFFILFILIYLKRKYLAIIPLIPLIKKFIPVKSLASTSTNTNFFTNYASNYWNYMSNMIYVGIFFVIGGVISFFKKRLLSALILLPSIILLISLFSLKVFAMRYAYFFVFPLVLYFALFFAYLYDKFGKQMIVLIALIILIPSNLFFPFTGVNIIKPISHGFYDSSAPTTDYKAVPEDLIREIRESTLISYFSSNVEWYIKKPDYVVPFSMSGIGKDSMSINNAKGEVVDRYSGSLILKEDLKEIPKEYYLTADGFSISKLKPDQFQNYLNLIENCTNEYESYDLSIWYCNKAL
jgi:hypothetical protein